MSIETIKNQIPSFAKDVKLNLATIRTPEGAPDLTQKQIDLIAIASAYAIKQPLLIKALSEEVSANLSGAEIEAAQSAALVMAMNNVYYRFMHLVHDDAFSKMPVRLRMNLLQQNNVDKKDFELMSLAISAINGCGLCLEAHHKELRKENVSHLAIQSAVRIASVLNAVAMSLEINALAAMEVV